jgi:cytochrome c553
LVWPETAGIIAACSEAEKRTNENPMRNLIISAAFVMAASLMLPADCARAGDSDAGKVKSYTCTGCHGIPGYNNVYPTYKVPKIGGQNYEYLTATLKAYRSGERQHPTMQLQAGSLSDTDIDDIATYFASLGNGN